MFIGTHFKLTHLLFVGPLTIAGGHRYCVNYQRKLYHLLGYCYRRKNLEVCHHDFKDCKYFSPAAEVFSQKSRKIVKIVGNIGADCFARYSLQFTSTKCNDYIVTVSNSLSSAGTPSFWQTQSRYLKLDQAPTTTEMQDNNIVMSY